MRLLEDFAGSFSSSASSPVCGSAAAAFPSVSLLATIKSTGAVTATSQSASVDLLDERVNDTKSI